MTQKNYKQNALRTVALAGLTGALAACGSDSSSGGSGSSSCSSQGSYSVGDVGPGGGLIFFVDTDNVHDSFTYLEAAPADLDQGDGIYSWAGVYDGAGHFIGASDTAVGTGAINTAKIVTYLDQDGQTNRAGQLAAAHEVNGCSDWFLPSKDELNLMHVNLYQQGLGDFDDAFTYWSSSEANWQQASGQSFGSGTQTDWIKTNRYRVRPARAF